MTHSQWPGPVAASDDLRTMLRRHLARRAAASLERMARRRHEAMHDAAAFGVWQHGVRDLAEAMLDIGADLQRPLNARLVSSRSYAHFDIENVLLDSLGGWQVNATLFRPNHLDGPFHAVVVPCGHGAKSDSRCQLVCQILAMGGYLAITFDPPGQSGEKREGNDHFVDGARCYAVGQSSQRYFVGDALTALNYLQTRDDVDTRFGFAVTGVSGGAITALHAAAVDQRIAAIGLACGPVEMAKHPIGDGYAICPEKLPTDRLRHGVDDIDLMAALAPRPLLCMVGKDDATLPPAVTQGVLREVGKSYEAAGAKKTFEGEVFTLGHAYKPDATRRFVRFLETHWPPAPRRGPGFDQTPTLLPPEAMQCEPAPEPNLRTLSAQRAEQMRLRRPKLRGRRDAAEAVQQLVPGLEDLAPAVAQTAPRRRAWNVDVQEALLTHEIDVTLPATLLWPLAAEELPGAVVVFDDRGRWAPIAQDGWASKLTGTFDRDPDTRLRSPIVMSVDLRGWGDTMPAHTAYDIAPWAGRDRWPNYVANALGDGLMAQRVRDALAATYWLQETAHLADEQLAFAGRGLGAVVALMVGCLCEHARAVVCIDGPHAVQDVVQSPHVAWDFSIFMPRLLELADLYELSDGFGPVYHVRPRDGQMQPMNQRSDADAAAWLLERFNPA